MNTSMSSSPGSPRSSWSIMLKTEVDLPLPSLISRPSSPAPRSSALTERLITSPSSCVDGTAAVLSKMANASLNSFTWRRVRSATPCSAPRPSGASCSFGGGDEGAGEGVGRFGARRGPRDPNTRPARARGAGGRAAAEGAEGAARSEPTRGDDSSAARTRRHAARSDASLGRGGGGCSLEEVGRRAGGRKWHSSGSSEEGVPILPHYTRRI